MSSIPVVRRPTARATRPLKGTENANTKTTRVVMHGKTVGGTTTAVAVTSRLTAPTVASKAKTVSTDTESKASKRKREALVEVAAVNKGKTAAAGGKGQEGKEAASSKPRTGAAQRVAARRVAVPASRVPKPVEDGAASNKTKEPLKPSDRTRVTKVYRDDVPAEEEQEKKAEANDDEDEDELRASKRRHTEMPKRDHPSEEEIIRAAEALAEPEPQLWDDLDADDWDDPLMCSEYVQEVCKYWKEVERETLPNSNYMDRQDEVTWDHRAILIDWLINVHARFNMLSESLFLTVNLIDRFLGLRLTSLPKLQLVGLTCFFIATKFEETCAPSVTEIVSLCEDQFSVNEVLRAERYVLQTLNWDLRDPGPMSWLRRGSKADNCCTTARTVAKYLLEIGCIERRLVGVVPSHMAAAALWLARLAVGRVDWDATLEHYTTFSEKEIIPVATVMLEYIITTPIQHESLFKKYAHKRYMKCSSYLRQWALERWHENSDIYLERDLSRVKDEILRHQAVVDQE